MSSKGNGELPEELLSYIALTHRLQGIIMAICKLTRRNQKVETVAGSVERIVKENESLKKELDGYVSHYNCAMLEKSKFEAENEALKAHIESLQSDRTDQEVVISTIRYALDQAQKTLECYAKESNWGNGGFNGHPNDIFMPSRGVKDRAWKRAKGTLILLNKTKKCCFDTESGPYPRVPFI